MISNLFTSLLNVEWNERADIAATHRACVLFGLNGFAASLANAQMTARHDDSVSLLGEANEALLFLSLFGQALRSFSFDFAICGAVDFQPINALNFECNSIDLDN